MLHWSDMRTFVRSTTGCIRMETRDAKSDWMCMLTALFAGCIDDLYHRSSYTALAYNNTYSIPMINETTYLAQLSALEGPGGVIDLISACQSAARTFDPHNDGTDDRVNAICQAAAQAAAEVNFIPFFADGRFGAYDFTHLLADPFPRSYYRGFLNQEWVQRALGVPVNHTSIFMAVNKNFAATMEFEKGGFVEDIAYLLDRGLKVSLVYGDRDWWVHRSLKIYRDELFWPTSGFAIGYLKPSPTSENEMLKRG